jgi:DNA-directed RNA polymerase specialized sigma24 family protein
MNLHVPTTETLHAAADGDSAAWAQVLDEILPCVLGWCTRMGGPSVDAEDAAHDVCLVVLERLATLRDPQALPSWLYQITRKVLASHRRRARWASWSPLSLLGSLVSAPVVDDLAGAGLRLLDALPDEQREVLVLCGVEERTCEEAAQLLDLPVGTVKSRLRLARARFVREARVRGVLTALETHVPEGR